MTESQPDVLAPARPTRAMVRFHWLGVLVGLAALAILTVALVVVGRAYQHSDERAEALRVLKVKGYQWVWPTLIEIAERDGDDLEVIREIALGALKLYHLENAETYLNRWCDLEPAAAEPHLKRLRLFKYLNRVDEAVRDGNKLVEIAPDDLDIQKEVTALMIEVRHYPDAERNCLRLLPQHPDDPSLRYCLAECRHSQGQDEEARALLDAILIDDPNHADALVLRAILLCDAGQDADAIPLLRRVRKEEPYWVVPCYYLSLALARAGHADEAEKEAAEAQRLLRADRVIRDAQIQPENLDQRVEASKLLIQRGRAEEIFPLISDVLNRRRMYDPALRIVLGGELAKSRSARRYR